MKPSSIYLVRSDGLHLICSACSNKIEGEKYCDENEKNFSHGICPECEKKPVPEGEVFPVQIRQVEKRENFRPAGFLLRHKIETSEDMEAFLNGEL